MGAPDRRLRVVLPTGAAARQLRDLCDEIGALQTALSGEEGAVALEARFAAEQPGWLEDRVETWLDLVDPGERAQLWTASGQGGWQPGWRAVYRGADVGRFHIRPPWAEDAPGDAILIDPRGGFGSGLHPTTEVALRLLEAYAQGREGQPLLDVGAGTGLLSVAAARCGLLPTAIDLEARARAACARTAALNGVAVRVLGARLEELAERFPVVIANLPFGVLLALRDPLRAVVAPGGTLLLSGPRIEDLPAVLASQRAQRAPIVVSSDGEWGGAAIAC